MKTLLPRAALAAAAMALGLSGAYASTATGTLGVTLNVTAPCTVSTTPISFSSTGELDADATGSISITCPSNTHYTVALGDGQHGHRRMQISGGSANIPYELYSDSDRKIVWNSISTVGQLSTGSDSITVYGHAQSTGAATGYYLDVVTVTVNY